MKDIPEKKKKGAQMPLPSCGKDVEGILLDSRKISYNSHGM
jgi:hypothetical protein